MGQVDNTWRVVHVSAHGFIKGDNYRVWKIRNEYFFLLKTK